jgi:hypothetical protein
MQPHGNSRQNRRAIGWRAALQCFFDMFEAGLDGNTMAGQQGKLRRTTGEGLQGNQAVGVRKLADRVHAPVQVQWGKPRAGRLNLCYARADLKSYAAQWISGHHRLLVGNMMAHQR